MPRSLLLASLLALAPLACTVTVNSGDASPPADDAKPNGEGEAADADAGSDNAEGEGEGEGVGTLEAVPQTGMAACPADPGEDSYCTEDSKLAGQWVMADQVRIPEGAETVFEASHADDERQPSLTIAVEGDELYIKQVTCGSCARILGQGFRGSLSSMSDEQVAAVQARLGLPEDAPKLTSTQRWRDYAGEGAGAEALTAISTKTE